MRDDRGTDVLAPVKKLDGLDIVVMVYLIFGSWIFPLPLDDLGALVLLLRGRIPVVRRLLKHRPILTVIGLVIALAYGATLGATFSFFTGGDELLLFSIIWKMLQIRLPDDGVQG